MNTKESIITTAFQLFLQDGFKEVSVNRIIDHCGISKGAFYHHFQSKDDLYLQVLDRFFFNYFSQFQFSYASDMSFEDKIKDFVLTFITPYEELLQLTQRKDLLPYFRFLFQSATLHPQIQYRINKHFYKKGYYLAQLIEQEQSKNRLTVETDSKKIARYLLSIVLGMTILDGIYEASKIKSHLEESIEILLFGLVKNNKIN
jgi:AcrR family transcriptional regulator